MVLIKDEGENEAFETVGKHNPELDPHQVLDSILEQIVTNQVLVHEQTRHNESHSEHHENVDWVVEVAQHDEATYYEVDQDEEFLRGHDFALAIYEGIYCLSQEVKASGELVKGGD